MLPPKYPSTPHWPWSEKVHRDDTYHVNPEHFLNRPVVITEKLDGGNTCLYRGEVYARSVTAPSRAGWMAMVRKHHAWKTLEDELVYYGEDLYGVHSIAYDPLREQDTYHLFALRSFDPENQKWDDFLPMIGLRILSREKGFPMVPELFAGTFSSVKEITEWFRDNLKLPSILGPTREGFVMRTEEGFPASEFATNVCKYVRANHVQTDEHWTKNWQPCKLIKET